MYISAMENYVILLCIILISGTYVRGLIIPEEVPTILSLIYSNIPPIKKGTDSRVGVGFRLGPHADFQLLFEIGPQRETEPIGNTVSKKRRQTMLDAAMKGEYGPWSQSIAKFNMLKMKQQHESKLMKNVNEQSEHKKSGINNNWLIKWSEEMDKITGNKGPNENSMFQKIRVNNELSKLTS